LFNLNEREQICCAPSCKFDEKRATKPKFVAQSRPALYFSQHHFAILKCSSNYQIHIKEFLWLTAFVYFHYIGMYEDLPTEPLHDVKEHISKPSVKFLPEFNGSMVQIIVKSALRLQES